MHRTTIFVPDELEVLLNETSKRTGRPRAAIVRDALTDYLGAQQFPLARSIGAGMSSNQKVNSENVKQWVHRQWGERART